MGQQLEQSLIKASDGGKIPIVMDTSPCLAQMKGALTDPALRYTHSGLVLWHLCKFCRRSGSDFAAPFMPVGLHQGAVMVCNSIGLRDTAIFCERPV